MTTGALHRERFADLPHEHDDDDADFIVFMGRVGRVIGRAANGMDHTHFRDAEWNSLFGDVGKFACDSSIRDCLACKDPHFARIARENGFAVFGVKVDPS